MIAIIGGESLSTPAMIGLPLAVAGGLLASVEKAPAEEVFGLDEAAAIDDPRTGIAVDAPAAAKHAVRRPVGRPRHVRRRLGPALVGALRGRHPAAGRGERPAAGGHRRLRPPGHHGRPACRWRCCSPACGSRAGSPVAAAWPGVRRRRHSSSSPRRSPSGRWRWRPSSSPRAARWRSCSATSCCTSGCRGCSTLGVACTCVACTLLAIEVARRARALPGAAGRPQPPRSRRYSSAIARNRARSNGQPWPG